MLRHLSIQLRHVYAYEGLAEDLLAPVQAGPLLLESVCD